MRISSPSNIQALGVDDGTLEDWSVIGRFSFHRIEALHHKFALSAEAIQQAFRGNETAGRCRHAQSPRSRLYLFGSSSPMPTATGPSGPGTMTRALRS